MKLLRFITVLVAVLSITLSIPATTVLAAPAAPSPTYPTNGELVTSYAPSILFTWTATAPVGGVYDIEISTDGTFTDTSPTVLVDGSTAHHTHNCQRNNPTFLSTYPYQPATTYYFRIQAYTASCTDDGNFGALDGTGSGW